jgi:hypothetical protein
MVHSNQIIAPFRKFSRGICLYLDSFVSFCCLYFILRINDLNKAGYDPKWRYGLYYLIKALSYSYLEMLKSGFG